MGKFKALNIITGGPCNNKPALKKQTISQNERHDENMPQTFRIFYPVIPVTPATNVLQFPLQEIELLYLTATFSSIMLSECCSLLRFGGLSSHPSGSSTLELLQNLSERKLVGTGCHQEQYADFNDPPFRSQEFK